MQLRDVAGAAGLGPADEDVVDAAVGFEVAAGVGVGVASTWRPVSLELGGWPATSHASWNTSFGTGGSERPVSIRISSLSGSALKSPHEDRREGAAAVGLEPAMNAQIDRTWSWRMPLWSKRQLRWVQNTWSAPRGPSMSARSAGAQLLGVGTAPAAAARRSDR